MSTFLLSRASTKAKDNLLDLETKLMSITAPLAEELAKPAFRRDADMIRSSWEAIDGEYRKYNSLAKRISITEPPDRKALKPRDYREAQKIYELYHSSRKRIRDWNSVGQMVMAHADPSPTPLIDWDLLDTHDELLGMIDMAFHTVINLNRQNPEARAYECFPDIPMPARPFDQLVSAAYRLLLVQGRAKDGRFLDVGCGGGSRCFLANRHFRHCVGLEYDKGYVRAAENFFDIVQHTQMKVIHADGITFEHYDDYDVIYFYRPMKDTNLLGQLEQKIINDARPGTIILAPYNVVLDYRKQIDAARVEGPIFIAGISQEEADEIGRAAQYTDTRTVASADDVRYDAGFWGPLIDASSYDISST
ncbi:MAG: hypothetical protein AAGG09_18710 [Pseudomonadota bacterium]